MYSRPCRADLPFPSSPLPTLPQCVHRSLSAAVVLSGRLHYTHENKMQMQSSSFFAQNGGVKSVAGAGAVAAVGEVKWRGVEQRSRPGCAGRHCIFVNQAQTHMYMHTHLHAHTRTYTHMHAHQHLVHFYFVLLVLLVFSTDIVFCALFWCCFHFCFVYFQRLFFGVATGAGPRALRSPS